MLIRKAIQKHCRPGIKVKSSIIKVSGKKWVVVFEVWPSKRKPVRFKGSGTRQVVYIRYQDKTLQASREAEGILQLKFGNNAVSFSYGDMENKILKALDGRRQASLEELKMLTGIVEPMLSHKLIHLAAANVIGWKPLDRADIFLSVV